MTIWPVLMLQEAANISFRIVHFDGAAQQFTAILGGHVDVAFDNVGSVRKRAQAGEVRVLAVIGFPALQADAGFANLDRTRLFRPSSSSSTRGFGVPKGTLPAVVKYPEAALRKPWKTRNTSAAWRKSGLEIRIMTVRNTPSISPTSTRSPRNIPSGRRRCSSHAAPLRVVRGGVRDTLCCQRHVFRTHGMVRRIPVHGANPLALDRGVKAAAPACAATFAITPVATSGQTTGQAARTSRCCFRPSESFTAPSRRSDTEITWPSSHRQVVHPRATAPDQPARLAVAGGKSGKGEQPKTRECRFQLAACNVDAGQGSAASPSSKARRAVSAAPAAASAPCASAVAAVASIFASLISAPPSFSSRAISSSGRSVNRRKKRPTSASSVLRQNCQ